ncbi:hypothetical protein [Prosthecobacter fluviatilis]|uniref:TRAM domain-containing protein n=1 Tax=Prosthecobacter fluviatilis TaxID=445931 RepID=A0ABW0KTN7_9BACT
MEIITRVETTATILRVLSPRTCHAVLPNGKEIFGTTQKHQPDFPLQEGATVRVSMHVCDFSYGEMLGAA